jgi:hypothetical protein
MSSTKIRLAAGEARILSEGLHPATVLLGASAKNEAWLQVWFTDDLDAPLERCDSAAFAPGTVCCARIDPGMALLVTARRVAVASTVTPTDDPKNPTRPTEVTVRYHGFR